VFALYLYIITLLIAPQLWIHPFIGLPTDYICLTLMLLLIVITGRLNKLFRWQPIHYFLIAFVVWVTLSAALTGFSYESQAKVILYCKYLLLFILMTNLLEDDSRTRKFATFFCMLAIILAVESIQHRFSSDGVGWANQTLGWIDPDALAAGEKGRSRWIGIFDGPGVFSVLFPVAAAFMLGALKTHKDLVSRIVLSVFLVILGCGLYCTGSRGGMLAMLAVICTYLMLCANFSFISLAIGMGLVLLTNMLAPSYLTTLRDQSHSTSHRVEMWAEGLDMLKSNLIWGVGIGNFRKNSGFLIAHNSAIEIMGETGLIGLLLWISILYFTCTNLISRFQKTEDESQRWFFGALLLSVVGYVASAMFVTLEYETYYIILAMCTAAATNPYQPVLFGKRDAIICCGLTVALVAILQVFVIKF
jgi:putative inorganic carbon (hco3(-)) transporter